MSRTSKRSRDTKGSAERLTGTGLNFIFFIESANKEKTPIETIKIKY